MTTDQVNAEFFRARHPAYFTEHYCRILDGGGNDIPFRLWPSQAEVLKTMTLERLVVLLKARQIGMTTLVVCFAVHLSIYKPGSTILLFSKAHLEAKDLLNRIRTTIRKLPAWLRPRNFAKDTTTELGLSNGSRFVSFGSMSSGGDSYTANLVIVDEADLIRDLDALLSGAKPTIDGGGKLVMLSRTDKSNPDSPFKRICRAAFAGKSKYVPVFFPWWVRPDRNQAWYEEIAAEIEQRTFSRDELYANYPATAEEALSAHELDKRFPIKWLSEVFAEQKAFPPHQLKETPFAGWQNLEVYRLPEKDHKYTIGMDVAGGNPNSDDSVAIVVDNETLEECAVLCGKIEPTVHAHRGAALAEFYNKAEILPEKNHSHGAKCLEALKVLKARILFGPDKKPGWFTDVIRKNLMYDTLAEAVRNKACIIHSKATYDQLVSIDVEELAAPFGFLDDRAVAYALAVQGTSRRLKRPEIQIITAGPGSVPAPQAPTKHKGLRWIATYSCWISSIEWNGARVDVGDYEEESAAAYAVNVGSRLTGLEPPNQIELTEEVGRRDFGTSGENVEGQGDNQVNNLATYGTSTEMESIGVQAEVRIAGDLGASQYPTWSGRDELWKLKDLRKTCTTYYDEQVPSHPSRSSGTRLAASPIVITRIGHPWRSEPS